MGEKILYRIQVGAYSKKANASKVKAAVEDAVKKGRKTGKLKEDISVALLHEGGLWKVQCGAFSSSSRAMDRLEKVRGLGFRKAQVMKVAAGGGSSPEVPGSMDDPRQKILQCMEGFIDSPTAHADMVKAFNAMMEKLGHGKIGMEDAWCTEFIGLMFYEAGLLDLIGYGKTSGQLVENAKALGTWKETSEDIVFGDVVIFCNTDRKPNHTEYALDEKYDVSGNYNGGVHKRARSGRRILGRIRPKYETAAAGNGEFHPKVRFWGIRFWEGSPEKYGDAECFIQYGNDGESIDHVVLVDTGMDKTGTVKKLQAAGVRVIDAILISHDHSDHYGFLGTILKSFTVRQVYLPEQSGVDRYMKAYGNRMRAQEARCVENKVPVAYLKKGDSFTVGRIRCDIIFQADPDRLPEKEGHHFINNMSLVARFVVDGTWVFHLAGDCQNDANSQLVSAIKDLKCDVFKIQWHGDRGAISKTLAKALMPLAALSNYHGKESGSNGRKGTYDVLRGCGCLVMRNYEDGEVYMDMENGALTVSGSKCGKKAVFNR